MHLNWWFVSVNFYLPLKNGNFTPLIYFIRQWNTPVKCNKIFSNHFVTNLLISLPLKELVKIGRSYFYEFGVFLFWDNVYIMHSNYSIVEHISSSSMKPKTQLINYKNKTHCLRFLKLAIMKLTFLNTVTWPRYPADPLSISGTSAARHMRLTWFLAAVNITHGMAD